MVTKDQVKAYKQLSLVKKIDYFSSNGSRGAELISLNGDVKTWKQRRNVRRAAKGNLRAAARIASDPTYDLALYNLIEAHPEIDYWTNIRVKRTCQGKKNYSISVLNFFLPKAKKIENPPLIKTGEETVTVTATGIDMLTDEELQKKK
jgi:hypothetical protein